MAQGISMGMGFDLNAQLYLDGRQSFEDVAAMKAFPETSVPDGFVTYVKDVKMEYVFHSDNTDDPDTGKWRFKKTGGADINDTIASEETVYSSSKVEDLFKNFGGYLVVETLPEAATADLKKIYLIADPDNADVPAKNSYNEYIVQETINYVSEAQFDLVVASTAYADYSSSATGASLTPIEETEYDEIVAGSYATYQDYVDATPSTFGWELIGSTTAGKMEYKTSSPVNNPVGKIKEGFETTGTPVQDILDMILHKSVAPTIAITCSEAGLKELGVSSVVDPVLTATITVGTATPKSIQFYKDGIATGTPIPYVDGQLVYTQTETGTTLEATTKYAAELTYDDDEGNEQKTYLTALGASYTYTFVLPFYYGALASVPTDETGMTKDLSVKPAATGKAFTFSGTNVYAAVMYDANYGDLHSILDQNGFETIGGFTKVTLVVGSDSYICYYTTTPATLAGFKYTFKF